MSEAPEKDSLLIDHDADGITELDNKLPGWWLWLFYITIAFGFVYMGYYHVFDIGNLTAAKYDKEMATAKENFPQAFQTVDISANADLAASTDAAVLAKGKEIFDANCVACHTADGGGLVGPNMCDDYYIHGGTYADSVLIINIGVAVGRLPNTGMTLPFVSYGATSMVVTVTAMGLLMLRSLRLGRI